MVLVDTSVWVDLFRDAAGHVRDALRRVTGDDDTALTRFNQLELLQGGADPPRDTQSAHEGPHT